MTQLTDTPDALDSARQQKTLGRGSRAVTSLVRADASVRVLTDGHSR